MPQPDKDTRDLAASAYKTHRGTIFRYLLRRTRSTDQAEELTQEVFADAVPALERFRPGATPVLALLYTIAQRRFADASRRAAVRPRDPASTEELADRLPEAERDYSLGPQLKAAFAELPPGLGTVASMKLIQGRSFSEIADHVGVSEVACRKRFQRALELLRESLEQKDLRA